MNVDKIGAIQNFRTNEKSHKVRYNVSFGEAPKATGSSSKGILAWFVSFFAPLGEFLKNWTGASL